METAETTQGMGGVWESYGEALLNLSRRHSCATCDRSIMEEDPVVHHPGGGFSHFSCWAETGIRHWAIVAAPGQTLCFWSQGEPQCVRVEKVHSDKMDEITSFSGIDQFSGNEGTWSVHPDSDVWVMRA